MATKTKPIAAATGTGIIGLAFELIAVGIITLLAGINNEMGKAMVTVMLALWLIYAITNSQVIATFGGFVATITGNKTTSPGIDVGAAPGTAVNTGNVGFPTFPGTSYPNLNQ